MAKFMIVLFTGLFIVSLGSVTMAGMLDKAVEATEKVDAMAKEAQATTDTAEKKAIEAQNSSTEETGSMVDQVKETAKETVNEQIDNLGK